MIELYAGILIGFALSEILLLRGRKIAITQLECVKHELEAYYAAEKARVDAFEDWRRETLETFSRAVASIRTLEDVTRTRIAAETHLAKGEHL